MMSEALQLATPLNEDAAAQIIHALEAINGIDRIVISFAARQVKVTFNEDLTSSQELISAIANAGYPADAAPQRAAKAGSCCGGCCH